MNTKSQKKLHQINVLFYNLTKALHESRFYFCARIVEDAYALFMTEVEKKLK